MNMEFVLFNGISITDTPSNLNQQTFVLFRQKNWKLGACKWRAFEWKIFWITFCCNFISFFQRNFFFVLNERMRAKRIQIVVIINKKLNVYWPQIVFATYSFCNERQKKGCSIFTQVKFAAKAINHRQPNIMWLHCVQPNIHTQIPIDAESHGSQVWGA